MKVVKPSPRVNVVSIVSAASASGFAMAGRELAYRLLTARA
jgi:hypothetical protein